MKKKTVKKINQNCLICCIFLFSFMLHLFFMILGRDIKKCYGACYKEQRVIDPVTKKLSTQSTMKDYYFKSQKCSWAYYCILKYISKAIKFFSMPVHFRKMNVIKWAASNHPARHPSPTHVNETLFPTWGPIRGWESTDCSL